MTSPPSLRLDAPPYELIALRDVLRRLVREAPDTFDVLFRPHARRVPTAVPPEIAYVLQSFGLIVGTSQFYGTLSMRRHGNHFYAMSLGGGIGEYRQDVWPETDALLAQLDGAAPGRVVDMGTGCGIVAIEATVRGHTVIATDLYKPTLTLAKFNAALNGITERLEFRQGHLFEPVHGETFDLVLTAPHYTKVADQLRLEALRAAAPLSTPTGRVVVATFCEWTDGEDLAMTYSVLAEHARNGFDVRVSPMPAAVKQQWFTVASSDVPIPGLTSRHRFLVEITRAASTPGTVVVTRPEEAAMVRVRYAPLRDLELAPRPVRKKQPVRLPMLAVVDDAADLTRLDELITAIRDGLVTIDGELPIGLHDACRFGARTCVPAEVTRGAVGAILDRQGTVRPCTHGAPLATSTTTLAALIETYATRAAATAQQRGCETCAAKDVCSRCLFPHVFDDAGYCATIRRWADAMPQLHRVMGILSALQQPTPPLRIKLRRTVPLLVARGRPMNAEEASPQFERVVTNLAVRWQATSTALAVDADGRCSLFWWNGQERHGRAVHPVVAGIGELVGDGVTAGELLSYLRGEQFPLSQIPQVFAMFGELYALGQR